MKVYVAMRPVDFRKGIDGLALAVQQMFGLDPFCGAVFVFRAKRADRIKLLVPAAATAPSSHAAARQSYRSEGTVELGKRTARLPRRATKPCAPRDTTAGHSGSGGPDTTPAAAWRPRCDA